MSNSAHYSSIAAAASSTGDGASPTNHPPRFLHPCRVILVDVAAPDCSEEERDGPQLSGENNNHEIDLSLSRATPTDAHRCGGTGGCRLFRALPGIVRRALSQWKIVLFGQLLSLALASTGAASATLVEECSVSAPTLQTALLYVCLTFHLVFVVVRQRKAEGRGQLELMRDHGQEHEQDHGQEHELGQKRESTIYQNNDNNGITHGMSERESDEGNDDGSAHDTEETCCARDEETDGVRPNLDMLHGLDSCPGVDGLETMAITATDASHMSGAGDYSSQQNVSSSPLPSPPPPSSSLHYALPCTHLKLHSPWWLYLCLALLDVEGNYLTVLAFRYTSFKSISLIDSLAIPSAMACSRLVLGRRYRVLHLIGASVCIAGSSMTILSDYEDEEEAPSSADADADASAAASYPQAILGDALAISGALLYGVSDTLAERAIKAGGLSEYLGMLGLFGMVVSIVQICALELGEVTGLFLNSECSGRSTAFLVGAFVAVNYLFYALSSRFLLVSEAALYNLSLLSGDLWAVAFSVVEEHVVPTSLFFASFVVVVGGVFIYEMAPSPIVNEGIIARNERSQEECIFAARDKYSRVEMPSAPSSSVCMRE